MTGRAHPDWLHHHLAITGPEGELARFRAAGAGSGVIPWVLDASQVEEDVFLRLMASPGRERRGIGAAGARLMAERLRETVQRRHARVTVQAGVSRACPLDLHALLPVPADVLSLGEQDPRARAWLWENWGTVQALRHVDALPADAGTFRVRFWSADWTPWRALVRLSERWPELSFIARPIYQ